VNPIRRGTIALYLLIGISLFALRAVAQQSELIYMPLELVPPDSVYVQRDAGVIRIGWYPPSGGGGQITGSRDFTYWYFRINPAISLVSVLGEYTGTIDQTLMVQRDASGTLSVDTIGSAPSIPMLAQIVDRDDTYEKKFNLGSNYTAPGDPTHRYIPGDPIRMLLVGQGTGDTLDTGVSLAFSPGIVDTGSDIANFEIDLQTFEGFHVWRGLSPLPSQMEVIAELSRQEAFMGIEEDSLYFLEWPKEDPTGRPYYELVDRNVFAGFTYYYIVSCFDRGYLLGKVERNKTDNIICDETAVPGDPASCESVARSITMTVSAPRVMQTIFAVPNPYRSGTSAETTPYYHNFPDGSIRLFNVPSGSSIKIFTISGDLVWEGRHENPDGNDGVVTWGVRNKHGMEVGSGVYVYRVEGPSGDMLGRIVIIR